MYRLVRRLTFYLLPVIIKKEKRGERYTDTHLAAVYEAECEVPASFGFSMQLGIMM